ncbi:MAG: MoaD/ThiS family protein [Planctomycetaceae bacterium]
MQHPIPRAGSLRILLFAGLVEPAGGRTLDIAWSGGTVADLRRALAEARPGLEPLLSRSAIAVSGAVAAEETRVAAGADVAILPPVSGG